MRYLFFFAAITGCVALGAPASAQTATGNLNVSVTIASGCTVAGGTIAFGAQTSLQTAIDQTGTVNVTCTNTTPYTVALTAGANGASVTTRRMRGGSTNTEFVNYALFTNAGRTTNWGQTIGTDTVAGTGNGSAQPLTIFGRVPAQAIGSPGSYTDTVTVTVTF
jgi:spore coat protein U-like protein